ncbi:hypothetical protein LWC35_35850 [Pseudonocardia kujensis]|uniref:hypothetical protein n=1 Tax=Pseudonocardia kujensis TaxID=1128675 RepID=UPI001E559757|nr:hypothetical protein [Pseudonocardia kujensis]MCE0768229.1 hypothetical protein [Pseudonocardia kujensis]
MLGFCSGGTLQSMALAALQHRGELADKVAGFALAVCVLDQARAGVTGAFLDADTAEAATAVSARRGNAETTRMTAALHRDLLDLGLRNALVQPGEAHMLGAPVDLSAITIDGYVVGGVADHISPWQACYRSTQLFGGRMRFVLSTSGHIAAMVNPPTNPKASYQVSADLHAEPTAWQEATPSTQGSWWPDYLAWLSERSGPDRDAPDALGGAGLTPLDPAPGVYVLDR